MGMTVYNWLLTHLFEFNRKIPLMSLLVNEYLYLL
jgi:hypothetical protein